MGSFDHVPSDQPSEFGAVLRFLTDTVVVSPSRNYQTPHLHPEHHYSLRTASSDKVSLTNDRMMEPAIRRDTTGASNTNGFACAFEGTHMRLAQPGSIHYCIESLET